MESPDKPSLVDREVGRIRELSKRQLHSDALAAAEVLAVSAPEDRDVLYLIAANQRCLNRIPAALDTLQRLERHHPRFSLLYQERGHCYTSLRDAPRAISAFQCGVTLNPALQASWSMLAHLYRLTGQASDADRAAEQVSSLQKLPPEVVRAGSLFSDGALKAAEEILRSYLRESGDQVEACRLLARIQYQRNVLDEAEALFEAALKLAPDYQAARADYVRVLLDRQKFSRAQQEINVLLTIEPDNSDYLALSAAACAGLGECRRAIEIYETMLAASPASAEWRVSLGNVLRSAGQQQEAIDCYRAAAGLRPGFGEAWWSLANLKTYRFSQDQVARMCAEEAAATDACDRYHLCFALGKAYEDRHEYQESWRFYERGNRLKSAQSPYDPELFDSQARQQIALCTREFFAVRAAVGAAAADPIFIVGLPRSGSTLVEQILASHSQVEGTRELPEIPRIVAELPAAYGQSYPVVLGELAPGMFRKLGEQYLSETQMYRHGKPFFIDKMPNNFRHLALIHLMLPNAKIIDVRRDPMACCFSNLKQLFAKGQEFTYSPENIARYYRTYLDLMRHWDSVLPGRVLRVSYEDLLLDLAGNVRRMLDFCSLPFETGCVEFYRTARTVHTASSEQVRQPISTEGASAWRNYAHWLSPLQDALADAVVAYRE